MKAKRNRLLTEAERAKRLNWNRIESELGMRVKPEERRAYEKWSWDGGSHAVAQWLRIPVFLAGYRAAIATR